MRADEVFVLAAPGLVVEYSLERVRDAFVAAVAAAAVAATAAFLPMRVGALSRWKSDRVYGFAALDAAMSGRQSENAATRSNDLH